MPCRCINQHGKVRPRLFSRVRWWRPPNSLALTTRNEQTGLTQACLESKYTMEQVDQLVTEYVTRHFPPEGT